MTFLNKSHIYLLLVLFIVLVPFLGQAREMTKANRLIHDNTQFRDEQFNGEYSRIVLKFHDGTGIRSRGNQLSFNSELQNEQKMMARRVDSHQITRDIDQINQMILEEENVYLLPLLDDSEESLRSYTDRAEDYWSQELAELQSYQQIVFNERNGTINALARSWVPLFNGFSSIEIAYVQTLTDIPTPGSKVPTENPNSFSCVDYDFDQSIGDLTVFQDYRDVAPVGINLNSVINFPGGQADGVRIIDVEAGYGPHKDHEPLLYLTGRYRDHYYDHGTSVIGILKSKDNEAGVTGIAPDAQVGFRSIKNKEHNIQGLPNNPNNWYEALADHENVAYNLYWAAKHSDGGEILGGGVVLIELQRPTPQPSQDCVCNASCLAAPIEYWPAEYDVIKAATGNGTIVVESAGNGGRSLDSDYFSDKCNGQACFDRDVRDSGAILVSASMSDGLTPVCEETYNGANYGSGVDVHSWGENVVTTGGSNNLWFDDKKLNVCNQYKNNFNGTSSATAIVAGAAAVVQGVYSKEFNLRMHSQALRELLINTGTPQLPKQVNGHNLLIGPQPDVKKAIETFLE